MKTFFIVPTFLAAASLSAVALAQNEVKEFSEVDQDGDGLLSIEEAREALPDDVVIVDTNNDGQLNRDEVQSAMPEVSFNEGTSDEPVGENDYEEIRSTLEQREQGVSPQVDQNQGTELDDPEFGNAPGAGSPGADGAGRPDTGAGAGAGAGGQGQDDSTEGL